jgi:sialate O-acetylesterase
MTTPEILASVSLAAAGFAFAPQASNRPSFEIRSGITADQVFQRDTQERARITIRGRCELNGTRTVEARIVTSRGLAVPGLAWRPIATIAAQDWEGALGDVPTGGPYRFELRARGSSGEVKGQIAVDRVMVGDLWILAGQSNMHGRGDLATAEEPDERVHNFDLADRWSVAKEPVGDSLEAIDPAHWGARDSLNRLRPTSPTEVAEARKHRTRGASPALSFAKLMVARTGVPIGLIPCARGATSLTQWSAKRKAEGAASLYGSMLRRFEAVGGRVRGLLWYQGESDAMENGGASYAGKFREFIRALRTDFRQPDLPVYYVQIGRYLTPDSAEWNKVQLAQLEVESDTPHVALAPAVDLELADPVHLNTPSLKRLGRRLANLALADMSTPAPTVKRGPRPQAAPVEGAQNDILTLTFSEVNGSLVATGRLDGFSLRDRDGSDLFAIYTATLDPQRLDTVLLKVKPKVVAPGTKLWYGWGNNPHCNLRDEQDMAAPVFALSLVSE